MWDNEFIDYELDAVFHSLWYESKLYVLFLC